MSMALWISLLSKSSPFLWQEGFIYFVSSLIQCLSMSMESILLILMESGLGLWQPEHLGLLYRNAECEPLAETWTSLYLISRANMFHPTPGFLLSDLIQQSKSSESKSPESKLCCLWTCQRHLLQNVPCKQNLKTQRSPSVFDLEETLGMTMQRR